MPQSAPRSPPSQPPPPLCHRLSSHSPQLYVAFSQSYTARAICMVGISTRTCHWHKWLNLRLGLGLCRPLQEPGSAAGERARRQLCYLRRWRAGRWAQARLGFTPPSNCHWRHCFCHGNIYGRGLFRRGTISAVAEECNESATGFLWRLFPDFTWIDLWAAAATRYTWCSVHKPASLMSYRGTPRLCHSEARLRVSRAPLWSA